MPNTPNIYFVSPVQPTRDAGTFAGCALREFDPAPGIDTLTGSPPGMVVVRKEDPAVPSLRRFLTEPAAAQAGWIGIVADEQSRTFEVLAAQPPTGNGKGAEEDTRAILSKLRHSINNALTPALAETQLLLMDDHDEETYASFKTVEAKLRAIRDLVAAARPPAPTGRSQEHASEEAPS